MAISGRKAISVLAKLSDHVELYRKDNTDKFWSYKIKTGKCREFAFDPKTKTKLIIRFDVEPPRIPGVEEIESIMGKDVSTALDRVFSGGIHRAIYKAKVRDEEALLKIIQILETR